MSTNGHDEIANARAFLAQSEAGRHVLRLLRETITGDELAVIAGPTARFVKAEVQPVQQAMLEHNLNTKAFVERVERFTASLLQRVAGLEKRFGEFERDHVRQLEQRNATLELLCAKSLKNGGVWKPTKEYEPGDVVTCRGCAYVCNEANSGTKPGTSNAWRLMHKTIDGR